MTSMIKRVFLSLLIFINFLMAIAFLVSSYASYLHPKEFWFTGFLGLFFPYFLFSLLFFLVFWLFVKRWWALLSLVTLVAGYRTILLHFPMNLKGDFQVNKEQQDVIEKRFSNRFANTIPISYVCRNSFLCRMMGSRIPLLI